jgi:hypothetical protein
MAAGKLSGKARIEGVDTPGLVIEAYEQTSGATTSIYRTTSTEGGIWIIENLDTEKAYDVIMRTPTKGAVISDSRKPVPM